MNRIKATRTLHARNKAVPNVELVVEVVEADKLPKENLAVLVEAGCKLIGATWLTRQYGESTKAVNEVITANDLVEWFIETAGTRGSTKKDLEVAKGNVTLIKSTMAGLGARMAGVSGAPLTIEQFQELMTAEADKLKSAELVLAEAEKAEATRLAKIEADKKKKEAEAAAEKNG